MRQPYKRIFWIAAVAVATLVSAAAAQLGGDPGGNNVITQSDIFSRVQLVEVGDGEILRLDTQTGALFRFRGETGRNARGTFISVARPLRDENSGFLELQRVGSATFLVDVFTGQTWILRQRSATNAAWIEVRVIGGNAP